MLLALLIFGCQKGFSKSPQIRSEDEKARGELEMGQIETFDRLPNEYDSRLNAILSEPLSPDIAVSFYSLAVSKNPKSNYRWELYKDGRLFVTYHSGTNLTYEEPFDQPLPTKPTKTLTDSEVNTLYQQLERARFFEQPELQRTRAKGGSFIILRARRFDADEDGMIHEVVYQNVESSLINYLFTITD